MKTILDQGLRLVLVDVRSPEDYQKGHIPGARSLSLDEPASAFASFRREARSWTLARRILSGRDVRETPRYARLKVDTW